MGWVCFKTQPTLETLEGWGGDKSHLSWCFLDLPHERSEFIELHKTNHHFFMHWEIVYGECHPFGKPCGPNQCPCEIPSILSLLWWRCIRMFAFLRGWRSRRRVLTFFSYESLSKFLQGSVVLRAKSHSCGRHNVQQSCVQRWKRMRKDERLLGSRIPSSPTAL